MKDEPIVLLVDDDEDDHDIFNNAIHTVLQHCALYNAFNAEDAFHILQTITPDFIFLDMHMPRINGIECLKRLKEIYGKFPFKVVMFSTGMSKELCEQATHIGADFCVKKPASIEKLEQMLIQVCIKGISPHEYLF